MTRTLFKNSNTVVLLVCFIVAFAYYCIIAVSISPITPWEGGDSCVFKHMGLAILQGKTPYIDLFDHKGPLLYMTNALGLWIGHRWGLFLLAVTNFTLVIYLWVKIAKHHITSMAYILPVFLVLALYSTEGNKAEDWSLLPLSYSLFFASRAYKLKLFPSDKEAVAMGVAIGALIFLKANCVVLAVNVSLFIIFLFLYRHAYNHAFKFSLYLFLGTLIVCLFILSTFFILYGKEGIAMMIYGAFVFNMGYSSWSFDSLFHFFFNNHSIFNLFFGLTLFFLCLAYLNNRKEKGNITMVLFMAFSFLSLYMTMGTNAYDHYLIIVLPLFVLTVSYVLGNRVSNLKNLTMDFCIPILIILLFSVDRPKITLSHSFGNKKREFQSMYYNADKFIKSIKESERHCIWNYNARFDGIGCLQHNNIVQCNRVILNFQYDLSDYLANAEKGKLIMNKPKFLLFDKRENFVTRQDSVFIQNNYMPLANLSDNLVVLEYRQNK